MTRVYIETDGNRHILYAKGHAAGSVEVCAAVSGILYALAGWLRNAMAEPERYTVKSHRWRIAEADVMLDVSGDKSVEAAFDMAAVGLLQIERQHPEYISVELQPR